MKLFWILLWTVNSWVGQTNYPIAKTYAAIFYDLSELNRYKEKLEYIIDAQTDFVVFSSTQAYKFHFDNLLEPDNDLNTRLRSIRGVVK